MEAIVTKPKRGRPRSVHSQQRGSQGGQPERSASSGRRCRRSAPIVLEKGDMVTARGAADARALALAAPPPRTLLGKINSHLICSLCRGYYVDATTIVECLHTFCRSCILKHLASKSYCPVCEMMINSAKPNIKLDKTLQDIVYKLVPGLFRREMARRREFYAARPDLAADATPEQRGEDTERVVFSPDEVISFSLEYAGDGEQSTDNKEYRRYLRCPAVVNVSHLKKFLSLKFDIDATHFFVELLYKRVPLPDHYTLMDVAYIYNWKRVEPMRFFYRIGDAIRAPKPKLEPKSEQRQPPDVDDSGNGDTETESPPHSEQEDEKSQFLNSFELTAIGAEKRSRSPPSDKEPSEGSEPKKRKLSVENPTTSTSQPPKSPEKQPQPPPTNETPTNKQPEKTEPIKPIEKPKITEEPKKPAIKQSPIIEKRPEAPKLNPLPLKRKQEPGLLERSLAKIGSAAKTSKLIDKKVDKPTEKSTNEKQVVEPPKPPQKEGNLKSLFNSCNINIPPSLSITLKDQEPNKKQDLSNKTQMTTTNNKQQSQQQQPESKDEGRLEIIKLPDSDMTESPRPQQQQQPPPSTTITTTTTSTPVMTNSQTKLLTSTPLTTKPRTETSTKGPVPNLKPISEAKLPPTSKPQTFQQTFLQSLQQQKEKPKFNKNRFVLPKMNTTPTTNKPEMRLPQPNPPRMPFSPDFNTYPIPIKSDSALDLSAPHPARTDLGAHAKALETMQSIAILADQSKFNQRVSAPSNFSRLKLSTQSNNNSQSLLRVPVPSGNNQTKPISKNSQNNSNGGLKSFPNYYQPQKRPEARSPNEPGPSRSPKNQPNQNVDRFQNRSPSSSPKLVIACPSPKSQSPERRQFPQPRSRDRSDSNISSPQITSSEPSGSKDSTKTTTTTTSSAMPKKPHLGKTDQHKPNEEDLVRASHQMLAQRAYLRQQLELQTQLGYLPPGTATEWFNNTAARAHFENVINSIKNAQASFGNNHGPKDK